MRRSGLDVSVVVGRVDGGFLFNVAIELGWWREERVMGKKDSIGQN